MIFGYSYQCCKVCSLPRCEYWTILWCATGGNREKNLLDSSISLSTVLSVESFTLLFSVFKPCSSRIVAELRPKGLNPKVAASFVLWTTQVFFQIQQKSQFFLVSSLIPIAFTNCSFKMNGINKIFKVLEHFVLIQAALGACIEQESQLIKKIVKRKEFFFVFSSWSRNTTNWIWTDFCCCQRLKQRPRESFFIKAERTPFKKTRPRQTH